MTMTTNTSRCRPGVRSMTRLRYFDRRRDRDQNGVAGGFPAPPADPFGDSERVRPTAFGQLLPFAGRGACGGGPLWRTAGCARPRAPVPVPAPPLRAQPAEGPLAGGAPCGDGGSGGAGLAPEPTPASGHCRPETWLSAVGMPDIPSGTVAPAAETPPASAAVPSAPPPASVALRRAQRDADLAPMPGTTAPTAPAVTRRKPNVDSRQLTWARSSAPSMPYPTVENRCVKG